MSDIKLDSVDSTVNMLKNKTNSPAPARPPKTDLAQPQNQQKQAVELHLSSAHYTQTTEDENIYNARVYEAKQQIQSNSYQINTNALAEKLLPQLAKLMR